MTLPKHFARRLGLAAASALAPLALAGCGGGSNGGGIASVTPPTFDPFGAVRYAVLSQIGDTGANALTGPYGVARDSQGDLYVTDAPVSGTGGRVVKFDKSGSFVTQFGTTGPGTLTEPEQVAVDAAGDVYVADYANGQAGAVSRVVEFDGNGSYLAQFGATGNSSTGLLSFPVGVAVDPQGDVYVTDGETGSSQAARVVKYDKSGSFLFQFGTSGSGALTAPEGITLDAAGDVYVADYADNQSGAVSRVVEFDGSGNSLAQFGASGAGPLSGPQGVAVDPRGNVYVSDDVGGRIFKFDKNGAYLAQFDTVAPGGGASEPLGLALDGAGDVYVADGATASVLVLAPQAGGAAAAARPRAGRTRAARRRGRE